VNFVYAVDFDIYPGRNGTIADGVVVRPCCLASPLCPGSALDSVRPDASNRTKYSIALRQKCQYCTARFRETVTPLMRYIRRASEYFRNKVNTPLTEVFVSLYLLPCLCAWHFVSVCLRSFPDRHILAAVVVFGCSGASVWFLWRTHWYSASTCISTRQI